MIKSSQGLFPAQRLARNADRETSHIAAKKVIDEGTVAWWELKILDVLSIRPDFADNAQGWSCKEVAAEISPNWNSAYYNVERRISALRIIGKVYIVCKRESKVGGGILSAYRLRKI